MKNSGNSKKKLQKLDSGGSARKLGWFKITRPVIALLLGWCAWGIPFFAQAGKTENIMEKLQWRIGGTLPPDASNMPSIGVAGPVTGIHNDVLLVAGGANFPNGLPWEGGKKVNHRAGFVFKKGDNGKLIFNSAFTLKEAIAYPASCSTPEGVVFVGGENESGILNKAWLLRWDAVSNRVTQTSLPDLPLPLSAPALTAVDATVYLAGGQTPEGTSNRFFSLNIKELGAGWKELPPLPKPLAHAVLLTQSNGTYPCLYLLGGRKSTPSGVSELSASVLCFDLKKNVWVEKEPLPYAVSAASGAKTGSSFLLLFSGDSGEVFSKSEALFAAIARETDPEKKRVLQEERAVLLAAHPGFRKEVLLYNTITNVWTVGDTLPYQGQVTTTAVSWGDDIYIPTGEIKAGVRTPDIIQAKILPHKSFFTLDYVVLISYLLLMVFIGVWSSSHQSGTDDYFKGGQRIPAWAAGLSIYGTQLSAITFMSIPAKTYATNWNYFFLQMTIIMVMPIIIRYFIPFFRRLNITSAYEYLEKRFNYIVRAIASLLFIFLQLGRLAIVLLLPSLALTLVTGIDVMLCILMMGVITIVYTMHGGIEAVIWTDVIQVVILLGGALLAIFMMVFQLDQPASEIWHTIQQNGKLQIFDLRFSFTEPTLWVVLIGGIAINVISYGTDQTVVQRYLTTKDEGTAKKSLRLGSWMTLPSALIFFTIGTLLFLFFRTFPEKVDIGQKSNDAIFPWYIVSQMPSGFIGFLISAIFAAAMSTLSSSINSITAAITIDFYKKFKTDKSEATYLRLARIITLIVGASGTVFALLMARSGVSSLWDQFNTILGLFTGGIGGLFVLGIFFKRANAPGALIGVLLSGAVQFIVSEYTNVNLLMYAFTGLVSCVFFGYIFSMLFPNGKKELEGLTYKTLQS